MLLLSLIIYTFMSYTELPCPAFIDNDQTSLKQWVAGQEVFLQNVERFGYNNCFSEQEIDDKLFRRIYGHSFKQECTTPRSELRYLKVLHYTHDGKIQLGEMICNHAISGDLLEIFRTLYEAHYPIERMILIDEYNADDERSMTANNSSAFNFRFISGTTRLSNHSRGMAIDINPLYNPYVRERDGKVSVEPEAGRPYVDRTLDFPYKIDHNDLCYKEFIRHGFTWGGDWTDRKDYQHFEKK